MACSSALCASTTISCWMRCSLCWSCLGLATFRWEQSPARKTMPISGARGRAGGNERLAHDGHLDCFPEVAALFAASAQVTANATEDLRSSQRAKASGDFLTHLDHADVLLALVVGEGHAFIQQEGQNAPIKILQPIQQIGRLALRAAALTWSQAWGPVASPPHHVPIALESLLKLAFVKLPALLPPLMQMQEQIAQLLRPHFPFFLPQELQFPQQVLVAQGMQAFLIKKIGLPVIMHHPLPTRSNDS